MTTQRIANLSRETAATPQVTGELRTHGFGAPSDGGSGFMPSCVYHDLTNGDLYRNSGTVTSATWTQLADA